MLVRMLIASTFIIGAELSQAAKEQAACGVPETAANDWQIEPQITEGIDQQLLCARIDKLNSVNANIHSILIIRGGRLVFEHYRAGADQKWGIPVVDWFIAVGNAKVDWFEAYGLGSQRIIVVPSLDSVVVFTTGLYFEESPGTTELLDNFILPAIVRQ
jgi:hypothetical protein